MFSSISVATPNTVATSSFTANANCQIGITEAVAVRVNGQTTSSRTIDLVRNDVIELDVMAGEPYAHKYVQFTFNGNVCYFAVASSSGSTKPTLKSAYRNVMWYDFPPPTSFTMSRMTNGGVVSNLSRTSTTASSIDRELAVLLDPLGLRTYFFGPAGNSTFHSITHASKPLGHAKLFNSASRFWESYILRDDGRIDKMAANLTVTTSTGAFANTRCIFSDGVTLYLGGTSKLVVLDGFNSASRTVSIADNIVHGAAIGSTVMVGTSTGRLLKLNGNSFDQVYISTTIGGITAFNEQFLVAFPENYAIKVYDKDGSFVRNIDTGDRMPMSIGTDGKRFVVTFADSIEVATYTSISAEPTIQEFSERPTYALPIGDTIVANNYLSSYNITIPPNPAVSGLNWPFWNAPVDVDTGSGVYSVNTAGEGLIASAAPNGTLLVDGSATNRVVSNATKVNVYTRSRQGRVRTAIAIGNYAFDFDVEAYASDKITTGVEVVNHPLARTAVFNFTVPSKADDVHIALSHGTLEVNGIRYNGRSTVSTGDAIKITIEVPENVLRYYSVLSIADSQFALTIASSLTNIADTKRFVEYGDANIVSTYTVVEDGLYLFPNYTLAKVIRDDAELSFPTMLNVGDVLQVHHNRASQWWLDSRDTILMSPTTNYVIRNTTLVDDQPDYANFGYVHLGVPDFESEPDNEVTISGLSNGYSVQIHSEFMRFSVNGAPWEEKPYVKNGDTVKAFYRVKNLFETMWAKTTLAETGEPYEWGELNIDPALGEYVPTRDTLEEAGSFEWDVFLDHIEEYQSSVGGLVPQKLHEVAANTPRSFQNTTVLYQAPRPDYFQASSPGSISSVGEWQGSFDQRRALLNPGAFIPDSFALTNQSKPISIPFKQFTTPRAEGKVYVNNTLLKDSRPYRYTPQATSIRLAKGTTLVYEPSFGYPATYTRFKPTFHHESSRHQRLVVPFYIYQRTKNDRVAATFWNRVSSDLLRRYHPGFRNFEGRVARYRQTPWMQLHQRGTALVTQQYTFFGAAELREKNPEYSWFEGTVLRLKPSKSDWSNGAALRLVEIVGYYSQASFATMKLDPYYFSPSFAQNDIAPKAVAPASASFANMPRAKEVLFSNGLVQAFAFHNAEHNWETFLPVQTGGYETPEAAEVAATTFASSLPHTVYQQPEGTFSFVLKRKTDLVCQIKGTNIFATKWLIGGG